MVSIVFAEYVKSPTKSTNMELKHFQLYIH